MPLGALHNAMFCHRAPPAQSNGRRRGCSRGGDLGAVEGPVVDLVGSVLVGLGKSGPQQVGLGGPAFAINMQQRISVQVTHDADMGAGAAIFAAAEEASYLIWFRDSRFAQAQKRDYISEGDSEQLEQAAKRLRLHAV